MSIDILIDRNVCSGCGLCTLVCSLTKERECNPAKARIYIERHMMEGDMIPRLCLNCEEPACVTVCPVEALWRDDEAGLVYLSDEKCMGCGDCVDACSFGGIRLSPDDIAIKCDRCDGQPRCLPYCTTGAIRLQDGEEITSAPAQEG